ncbi:galactose-1-phosphate uridylyltransferase [candidate division KSB1 bacterium]|nr:MAG: galactose-1-phosphate uridylyltransferase [candidate division KSB1 bacterium]
MPELRKDPIIGRWIIISTERAKRPSDFISPQRVTGSAACPFCNGNEWMTPPEIFAFRNENSIKDKEGWRVRVVPNKFPALRVEGNLDKKGIGIYDRMNGIGAHEVIIETPQHEVSISALTNKNIEEIILAYMYRMRDLKQDKRLNYGMLFKNVGISAGASLEHSHSQLIALPTVPKIAKEEMDGAKYFFDYRGRCIICDMVAQEREDGSRIIFETENFIAFAPYASRFPFETWIIPVFHQSHFEKMEERYAYELGKILKTVLTKLEKSLEDPPYNYMIHTAPFNYNDLEYYHWHIEIIPRMTRVAGFEWGTDFYINPVPPEDASAFLREIETDS